MIVSFIFSATSPEIPFRENICSQIILRYKHKCLPFSIARNSAMTVSGTVVVSVRGSTTTRPNPLDFLTSFTGRVLSDASSDLSGTLNNASNTSLWRLYLSLSLLGASFLDLNLALLLHSLSTNKAELLRSSKICLKLK